MLREEELEQIKERLDEAATKPHFTCWNDATRLYQEVWELRERLQVLGEDASGKEVYYKRLESDFTSMLALLKQIMEAEEVVIDKYHELFHKLNDYLGGEE